MPPLANGEQDDEGGAVLGLRGRVPVVLAGDGLVLREWRDTDLPLMPALFDDPDVARWTPLESPFDGAAAERYLTRIRSARAADRSLHLAVTTDGETPLGEVLMFVPPDAGEGDVPVPEVGYTTGPAHRERGLASRALALLVRATAAELGIPRVRLQIEPGNVAPRHVAAAVGTVRMPGPLLVRTGRRGSVALETWELIVRAAGR